MKHLVAIILAATVGSAALSQSPTLEENIQAMPCEDLAAILTETLSGATGELTDSQRLSMRSQAPGMVEQTIKSTAMGAAIGALPGPAGGMVGSVVTMIDQQVENRKDAERQRSSAEAQALQTSAVADLEIVAIMSEEHARRCEG